MRRSIIFAVPVLTLFLSACSSCHKPTGDADGGVDAAIPDSGMAMVVDASPTPDPSASAADTTAPVTGTAPASGGPFQINTKSCMGGLKTVQTGNHVSGHAGDNYNQKLAHRVDDFTCTIAGDICTGTSVSSTKQPGGKLTNPQSPVKVTMTRKPDGSFAVYYQGAQAASFCKP